MKWFVMFACLVFVGCYDYSLNSDDVVCDAERSECVVCTNSDCSNSFVVTSPEVTVKDQCTGSGITNLLLGSCWTEHCVSGEKTLIPKIAGVNCVFKPANSPNDDFVIGACNDVGICD